uniref:Signal recognition particle receptor subunit beta n=2 Tax=Plectus sambesii TaxID=2011161 RepID=A0A914X1X7_9BILA
MEDQMVISLVVASIVIFLTLLAFWLKKKATESNTILLVGLTDSGKTLIFSKLINGRAVATYTSMKENEYPSYEVANGSRKVKLVDVPGADRLRQRLQSHWLGKEGATVKGIVCVVDSATFSKRAKDVAEFLYDVLYESKRVPLLVACNKQDQSIAKSAEAIKTTLEKEFGLINKTRSSALASTDGDSRKRTLTSSDKPFAWSDLKRSVKFVECAAVDDGADFDLSPVEKWIGSV